MNIKEWFKFKIYNFKNNIKYQKIDNNSKFNIGLLLSAGTSSRFNNELPKQLYMIDNQSIISHSINSIINVIDKLIIITNSSCYNEIQKIIKDLDNSHKIIILINDINSRNESIKTGLIYINNNFTNMNNIIIHDSVRPFIQEENYIRLLKSNETYQYSQYYLKLVNGLVKKNKQYEIRDRDKYIEICTPICCNYNLYYFIFMNYIGNSKPFSTELLPILNLMNIPYNFIEGYYKNLRKITYIEDVVHESKIREC